MKKVHYYMASAAAAVLASPAFAQTTGTGGTGVPTDWGSQLSTVAIAATGISAIAILATAPAQIGLSNLVGLVRGFMGWGKSKKG